MFILKTLIPDTKYDRASSQNNINQEDPVLAVKEVIITNSNIDFLILFILSLLLLITSPNSDSAFYYGNPISFYMIAKININLSLLYFCVIFINCILANPIQKNQKIQEQLSQEAPLLQKEINKYLFTLSLPKIINKYWHTSNAILHFVQNILFVQSFGLSMIFWILYSGQKPIMKNNDYFTIHLIIVELTEFYSLFRFCFFLLKVTFNFILIPMYISAIYLGYVEDKFNFELNTLVNTKEYNGRITTSLRKSDIDEYCSICLNSFSYGDIVSTLPCNKRHMFHTYCLEKWFYNTVSCPLCRSNFSDKLEELVPMSARRREEQREQGINIPMQPIDGNNINPFVPEAGNNNNV